MVIFVDSFIDLLTQLHRNSSIDGTRHINCLLLVTLFTYVQEEVSLAPPGKIPAGTTEIPFEFDLLPIEGSNLYETYHGVNLSILYQLTAELARGGLRRNVTTTEELVVQVPVSVAQKSLSPLQH